jgi:hypothetical protein
MQVSYKIPDDMGVSEPLAVATYENVKPNVPFEIKRELVELCYAIQP